MNSCIMTCLTQNYTPELSTQAMSCQSQKNPFCEGKPACGSYVRLELDATADSTAVEDHSHQTYHHPTNEGFHFSLPSWFMQWINTKNSEMQVYKQKARTFLRITSIYSQHADALIYMNSLCKCWLRLINTLWICCAFLLIKTNSKHVVCLL